VPENQKGNGPEDYGDDSNGLGPEYRGFFLNLPEKPTSTQRRMMRKQDGKRTTDVNGDNIGIVK
jgi:hypothetical protein